MELLPSGISKDAQFAALLHDVIEDTKYTATDLLAMGYSQRTVQLVKALSRPPGITYLEWIYSIKESGDNELIQIKIADNKHNKDKSAGTSLELRYSKSLEILTSE
jgi:(p)ppGpp synthase/HD superfamily hydrolase